MVTTDELLAAGGRIVAGTGGLAYGHVVVDSRQVRPGDVFVCLPGEHTDGHKFWQDAVARGAHAVMVSRWPLLNADHLPAQVSIVWASDPTSVLWQAGEKRLARIRPRLAAVTGSVGKTTTKEFLADLLRSKWRTFRSEGNRNTPIGLALSVLEMDGREEAGVVELAMRGSGQIADLAQRCRPRVGVITVIGESHLSELGSRRAIAAAKRELFAALPEDGVAVLPAEEPFADFLAEVASCRVWRVGVDCAGDVVAQHVSRNSVGNWQFELVAHGERSFATCSLPGRHLFKDALLAAASAHALGLSLAEIAGGLERLQAYPGRTRAMEIAGVTVVDDTYNASPLSVSAALEALTGLAPSGRRLAVLGEMRELGGESAALHREVGQLVAEAGVRALVVVGDSDAAELKAGALAGGLSKAQVSHVAFADQAAQALWRIGPPIPGDVVLVKGSRALTMERAVDGLARRLKGQTP